MTFNSERCQMERFYFLNHEMDISFQLYNEIWLNQHETMYCMHYYRYNCSLDIILYLNDDIYRNFWNSRKEIWFTMISFSYISSLTTNISTIHETTQKMSVIVDCHKFKQVLIFLININWID